MRKTVTLNKEKKSLKTGTSEYWVMRWYDVSGKRRSKSIGKVGEVSKTRALKAKRKKENEFDVSPGARNSEKITLKQYTDKFFSIRQHDLSSGSLDRYKTSVRYLLYSFGEDTNLRSISKMDATLFKSDLASGKLKPAMKAKKDLSKTSVNLHMRNLKAIFNYAVKNLNLIEKNPFLNTVEIVKKSKRWHYVTGSEFNRLMDAATDNYKTMISLCRLGGLRRLEAYYLEWQDVNFDKSRLYIVGKDDWQPKDRESRVIPICPELQAVLLEAFENCADGAKRVCPTVNIENINRGVKMTIQRAGLKVWEKPLHTLRKSCITDWAGSYPIHAVKEWAGHSNISTTQQYYLQTTEEQYQAAAEQNLFLSKSDGKSDGKQEIKKDIKS